MRILLLILIALPALAQSATKLRSRPPCSDAVTANCVPVLDGSGNQKIGATCPGGATNAVCIATQTQGDNSTKAATTAYVDAAAAAVAAAGLPSQTGNGGKVLTTNGTAASWGTPSSGVIGQAIFNASAGSIGSPTYTGVVSGVTYTSTGKYTVTMSSTTGYTVGCMITTDLADARICMLDSHASAVTATSFVIGANRYNNATKVFEGINPEMVMITVVKVP